MYSIYLVTKTEEIEIASNLESFSNLYKTIKNEFGHKIRRLHKSDFFENKCVIDFFTNKDKYKNKNFDRMNFVRIIITKYLFKN